MTKPRNMSRFQKAARKAELAEASARVVRLVAQICRQPGPPLSEQKADLRKAVKGVVVELAGNKVDDATSRVVGLGVALVKSWKRGAPLTRAIRSSLDAAVTTLERKKARQRPRREAGDLNVQDRDEPVSNEVSAFDWRTGLAEVHRALHIHGVSRRAIEKRFKALVQQGLPPWEALHKVSQVEEWLSEARAKAFREGEQRKKQRFGLARERRRKTDARKREVALARKLAPAHTFATPEDRLLNELEALNELRAEKGFRPLTRQELLARRRVALVGDDASGEDHQMAKSRPKSQAGPEPASAGIASPPRLIQPRGRWTVVQFPDGAPVGAITELVIDAIMAAKAQRLAGEKWVALLGEFFMSVGRPVLFVSPDVPRAVQSTWKEHFEMFGPVVQRKGEPTHLAFRGRVLVWLQDDFERAYPTPRDGR